MSSHLTDLDELSQKVKNFHSRNYIDEAIKSYRAGAYRASLISTWVAVCVDIIEKIKELALTEDAAAVILANKLKAIDPSNATAMMAFEKHILEYACDKLELISHIEKSHLERLKSDRNLCAHPTFSPDGTQFSPLAELSLSYIVQASNYLLIQVPVKGKVAIERIYELIEETSFPEDEQKAFEMLSSDTYLGRVRDSVARNLTIVLIKRLFQNEQEISPALLNRISVSLGAVNRLYSDIYNDVINGKLNETLEQAKDKILKRALPFLGIRSEIWGKITNPVKVRLDGLIRSMDVDEMISYKVASLSSKNHDINKSFQETINDFETEDLSKLLSSSAEPILKDIAIEFFINSRSFDSAEYRGNNIIIPQTVNLTASDLERIFNGSYENSKWGINQILNAGGIGYFFAQLYELTKPSIAQHTDLWKIFWDTLKKTRHFYPNLREKLEADGIIEFEDDDDDDDDDIGDIPF